MGGKETTEHSEALALAGLIGQAFPRSLVSAVLKDERAITAMLDAGVLSETPERGWLQLADPAAAERAAAALGRSDARELCRKLAVEAEKLRLPEDLTASLFRMAEEFTKARGLWIRSAERACDRKAYAEALDCMVCALEVWPWNESPADRVRILREMARCAVNADRDEISRSAWQELSEYAEDNGKHGLHVEALCQLAGLHRDTARVTACYKKAAALAEEHLPPGQAARVLLDYVDNLASRVRIGLAKEAMERVHRLAGLDGSAALRSEVTGWSGLIASMAGEHQEAGALIEESLRIAIDNELPEQVALAYRRRANIADYSGDYGKEVQSHQEAIQYCREVEVEGQLSCLSCLAYACFRTGDWKQSLASAKAVLEDTDAHPALKGLAECVEGLIASFRGERKAAEKKLGSALRRLRIDGLLGMEFFVLMGQAFQEGMCGNRAEATRLYDETRTLWRESEDLHDVVPALLFAGGHYASAGHPDRLADCIDIVTTIMRRNPLEEARAALVALRGEQAFLEGDKKAFLEAMETAGSMYARIGLPLERIWVASSAACIAGRPGMDAECTRIARQLGLRPILALFEKPATGDALPGCDLTPRQLEVLQLLAEGLTSKEIGARLFLSPRTVEMHVSRLLDRLNCRTRPEAVRIAIENGWVGD